MYDSEHAIDLLPIEPGIMITVDTNYADSDDSGVDEKEIAQRLDTHHSGMTNNNNNNNQSDEATSAAAVRQQLAAMEGRVMTAEHIPRSLVQRMQRCTQSLMTEVARRDALLRELQLSNHNTASESNSLKSLMETVKQRDERIQSLTVALQDAQSVINHLEEQLRQNVESQYSDVPTTSIGAAVAVIAFERGAVFQRRYWTKWIVYSLMQCCRKLEQLRASVVEFESHIQNSSRHNNASQDQQEIIFVSKKCEVFVQTDTPPVTHRQEEPTPASDNVPNAIRSGNNQTTGNEMSTSDDVDVPPTTHRRRISQSFPQPPTQQINSVDSSPDLPNPTTPQVPSEGNSNGSQPPPRITPVIQQNNGSAARRTSSLGRLAQSLERSTQRVHRLRLLLRWKSYAESARMKRQWEADFKALQVEKENVHQTQLKACIERSKKLIRVRIVECLQSHSNMRVVYTMYFRWYLHRKIQSATPPQEETSAWVRIVGRLRAADEQHALAVESLYQEVVQNRSIV
eukprot:PhF_6_TR32964/c0_g1_i1/m.48518